MKPFPPVRSLHASLPNPVKSLQAIAAITKSSTPQAAKIRPALAIVPNSVIPLAVSLWQRQPAQTTASPMAIAPPNGISVQRASRFQTATMVEVNACPRSNQKQSSKGKVFQVYLHDRVVGEFPSQIQADATANRLRQWLKTNRSADQIQLRFVDDRPAIVVDDTLLVSIDSRLAKALRRNRELIAIDWFNQLRLALNAEALSLADAQMQLHNLSERPQGELNGIASWYGPYFHGRLTAAGEIFNQNELTAAHPSLPFNTFLKVTNLENGESVIVRINDRGPYVGRRSLDLSRQAARSIGSEKRGVVHYEAVILASTIAQRPSPDAIALNSTK